MSDPTTPQPPPPDGPYHLHVYPHRDSRLHVLGPDCWCHPWEGSLGVWTHNAKDCREAHERRHHNIRAPHEIWPVIAVRPPDYAPPAPQAGGAGRIRRVGRFMFRCEWDWHGHTIRNRRGHLHHCWCHLGPCVSLDYLTVLTAILGPVSLAFGIKPRPRRDDQPH